MCDQEEHWKVETIHHDHGQAHFQLQECLQHARVAHPNDALASSNALMADLIDIEDEEFDIDPTDVMVTSSGKKRIHAHFG